MKLTNAFLKGLNRNNEYEIYEVNCFKANVKDCKGCFYCWKNEEARCAISDEMTDIFQKYISADIVIWSFPIYFYGMPSNAKRVLDRLLPVYLPTLNSDDGETTYHPCRFNLEKQRYILFCSCAYYNTKNNVEAIEKQFEILYGNKCEMLFCSEGQLLSNEFLDYCTKEYLSVLEREGEHYGQSFKFSEEIKQKFRVPFVPIKDFIDFAEAASSTRTVDQTEEEYFIVKISAFFKGLALTYDANKLTAEKSVLEIQLTDYPYVCQLHIDKQSCVLLEQKEKFIPYRLKVIANLNFFTKKHMAGTPNVKNQGPDINALIELVSKFEKKGITKEMRFC